MSNPEVVRELQELIKAHGGRITFDQYQQACLYSPRGGFYSSRDVTISSHFGTSATRHPAFGALMARQLEQMWRLMGSPATFYVLEAGSGDGSLARSITTACERYHPELARALYYVAADYEPWWPQPSENILDVPPDEPPTVSARPVQRVRAEGLLGFRNVVGCILTNELHDNFPVHRFAIQGGQLKEVYVTSEGDAFAEVLDEPSTPLLRQRLAGLDLYEGSRGEISLGLEAWADQVSQTLERGFVINIDYGELAQDLYGPDNYEGTLRCFSDHLVGNQFYEDIGEQDITSHVDFSTLGRLGEERGLQTLGYSLQSDFLLNLGFEEMLNDLMERGLNQGISPAVLQLGSMAMMGLIEPEDLGDFKVLVQAKGLEPGIQLQGF